jgi:hypothetical protein
MRTERPTEREVDAQAERRSPIRGFEAASDANSVKVIEQFAGKITRRSDAFTALCQIVCAYSEVVARGTSRNLRIQRKYRENVETVLTTSELRNREENSLAYAVQEALSRVRRAMKNEPDLMRIEDSTSGP